MIRLIVRIDDAAMAANVGGAVHTAYRTFDIDHPEIEELLRSSGEKPNSFSYATLVGASAEPPSPAETMLEGSNG